MSVSMLGQCSFIEWVGENVKECGRMGKQIVVLEPATGHRYRIVRCHEHSDWIEADDSPTEFHRKD